MTTETNGSASARSNGPSSLPRGEVTVSVVVPVYNSAATLPTLVDRMRRVFDDSGIGWEIIFVDDNSRDASWDVLRSLHGDDPLHLTIIQLMRNFGQHNALMCGFHHARGAFVVTIDDDLQNPPEEIPRLLDAIRSQNLDLVYGSIEGEKQHGLFRNFGSWMITKFGQFIFQTRVKGSSFRIMRRELVRSILTYTLNFTYIDGLLAWNTQRIDSIPVAHHARGTGRSGYSFRRLATLALNMFTNFSLVPLQAVSLLGLAVAVLGFILGFWYLAAHFLGLIAVSGYASIIVAVLIMGGTQLLALGIMGEYLGRIHLNINRKPQFVVRTAEVADPEYARTDPVAEGVAR